MLFRLGTYVNKTFKRNLRMELKKIKYRYSYKEFTLFI